MLPYYVADNHAFFIIQMHVPSCLFNVCYVFTQALAVYATTTILLSISGISNNEFVLYMEGIDFVSTLCYYRICQLACREHLSTFAAPSLPRLSPRRANIIAGSRRAAAGIITTEQPL